MDVIEEGRLKGLFRGVKSRDIVFEFTNGKKWKQNDYKYYYFYAYMPAAKVVIEGGRYYLLVENLNEKVEVKRT